MPTWASILVAVISALIGPICLAIVNGRIKRQEKVDAVRHEQHQEERRKEIKEVVTEVVTPIIEEVEIINNKTDLNSNANLASLRNDILTCYYRCVEKGYRNDYDYQNVHHMFEAYVELNGNSYVADVVDRFDELPTKEEYEKNHRDN